jgi:hypothetical protein
MFGEIFKPLQEMIVEAGNSIKEQLVGCVQVLKEQLSFLRIGGGDSSKAAGASKELAANGGASAQKMFEGLGGGKGKK